MDPQQQPPAGDLRDFSRRVREATKRAQSRSHDQISSESSAADARESELVTALEELRVAEEELRSQNEELAAGRQALDAERARYRELFDFAPDAYLATDMNGTIREANVAAGKLLAVDSKFLSGKPIQTFFEESSRAEYRRQLDLLCDADRIDNWEIWLRPRNGRRTAVSIAVTRAPGRANSFRGYRWIIRDISARREAEEALRELNRELELRVASRTAQLAAANLKKDQLIFSERKAREEAEIANRVKSDFLALLSHEFRTPLQAIFGYTELLEREIHGPLNEPQRRDLKRIQQSQQHLLGLITTILEFARIESGHGLEVQLEPVIVNDVLSAMEGFVGPQLETKKLTYKYRCEDTGLVARADSAKLQQVILNLLANAIKFTPEGGAIALECDGEDERVRIRVTDSGVGIPADKLDAIFEPFVQLRGKDAVTSGTGLGLPISRRLATAMGGELTAASTADQGSTFALSLPRIMRQSTASA